nr:U6 snRNA-associated Sm-like protein LSm2 [Euglena gracilis]
MLFYSFFKTLLNKDVVVELKNDVMISGTLVAVDQFLNLKLENVVVNEEKCPHLASVRNCFVRGSVIRYVQLPANDVETDLLQDATRKEHASQRQASAKAS